MNTLLFTSPEDIDSIGFDISLLADFFRQYWWNDFDRNMTAEQIAEGYFTPDSFREFLVRGGVFTYREKKGVVAVSLWVKDMVEWVFSWFMPIQDWIDTTFNWYYRLVSSWSRRKGVMSSLQKEMEQYLRNHGVGYMSSTPYVDNIIAQSALSKMWYLCDGYTEKHRYMKKSL